MKKGFTLAEILITLTIIGVVAALTIPAVVTAVGERQTRSQLRKAFSTLNQAYSLATALNGITYDTSATVANLPAQVAANMNIVQSETSNRYLTADGIAYRFIVPSAGCEAAPPADTDTDTSIAAATQCHVIIDINPEVDNFMTGTAATVASGLNGSSNGQYYGLITQRGIIPIGASTHNMMY